MEISRNRDWTLPVPGPFHVLSHWTLSPTLGGRWKYFHFYLTEEEAEAQRGTVTFS
jgi:hypothetical protein